jgi:hypothetical protein
VQISNFLEGDGGRWQTAALSLSGSLTLLGTKLVVLVTIAVQLFTSQERPPASLLLISKRLLARDNRQRLNES